MRKAFASAFALLRLFGVLGCSPRDAYDIRSRVYTSRNDNSGNWTEGCPSSYDPERDYFPEKTAFLYSTQLKVAYHNNYKVVDFFPTLHLRDPLRYVLYQCGTPKPTGFAGAQFIEDPVQRAVLNEPAFGESVEELGVLDHLYAVNDAEAYTNSALNNAHRNWTYQNSRYKVWLDHRACSCSRPGCSVSVLLFRAECNRASGAGGDGRAWDPDGKSLRTR